MFSLRMIAVYAVAAMILVLAGPIALHILVYGRAQCYGVSLHSLAFSALVGAFILLLVLPVALKTWREAGVCAWRRVRRAALLLAMLVLVTWVPTEVWFGLDDYAFHGEVQEMGGQDWARARWRPFESFGLGYAEGKYYAHE
jgi:predicted acyltransferase